jgi:hypothetical protein
MLMFARKIRIFGLSSLALATVLTIGAMNRPAGALVSVGDDEASAVQGGSATSVTCQMSGLRGGNGCGQGGNSTGCPAHTSSVFSSGTPVPYKADNQCEVGNDTCGTFITNTCG